MTKLLADLLKKATPAEAEIICNLSLGQLNPPHVGTQFNVAEKTMIKVVAKFLNLTEDTVKKNAKKVGDLGSVIADWDWVPAKNLTVKQVYKALHDIEAISGEGSQEKKAKFIKELLGELDTTSAKYVVRVIIGKLRLGFSDMTVVDALSWMEVGDKSLRSIIEDAYNVCADIG